MSRESLTSKEKDFKKALLSGSSINTACKDLGIKKTTAYRIVDRLLECGELREEFRDDRGVLKQYNPRLFVDPKSSSSAVSEDTAGKIPGNIDGFNGIINLYGNTVLADRMTGISYDKKCPEGFVEGHIDGQIYIDVEVTGAFDRISDQKDLTCGYISREAKKYGKGMLQRKGSLRLFNQDITVCYRWSDNTGYSALVIYPSRLYLDPMCFGTTEEVRKLFLDRAECVMTYLEMNGWRFKSPPKLTGRIHFPFTTPGLAQHYDRGLHLEGADLNMDCSKGYPEVEMENSDDPLFMEKAKIMAQLPTEIMGIKKEIETLVKNNQELRDENRMQFEVMKEMTANMSNIIELQSQQMQNEVKQLELNNFLLKIHSSNARSNLINCQQPMDGDMRGTDQKKDTPKPKCYRPEGYL